MSVYDPQITAERQEQFTLLLVKHQGALRSLIAAMSPGWADVDELMQVVSVTAWRRFDQFQPGTHFLRWIGQIAKFELMNYLRKTRRQRLVFSEELLTRLADESADQADRLAAERRALDGCVAKLPEPERDALCRCYADGANWTEVARAMGRTQNSLYKWLNRIRATLLACVEKSLRREGVA